MHSILVITDAADTTAILSDAELLAAAGEVPSGDSPDAVLAELRAIGDAAAAAIMSECNVAIGQGAQPTLWRETLTQTFRRVCAESVILARRHEVEVASVTVDGTVLAVSEYEVDPESGILVRLSGDCPVKWEASKVVVVYEAGFEGDLPADLKAAASELVRSGWVGRDRDPLIKGETVEVPGVMTRRQDFWVGSVPGFSSSGPVPDIVAGKLKRYRNEVVA